jgi:hypothetical protein
VTPFFIGLRLEKENRVDGGKVGNLVVVFHFSTGRRRSCGNVGISRVLRDFQGAAERVEILWLDFQAFHGPAISTAVLGSVIR